MEKQKILIVDDKTANLVALESVLSGIDAELVRASGGNDALKLTLHNNFSLAILDVQMPEMDGYELAQYLRQEKETSKIPIIFLSAVYSDYNHIFKGYRSGAVDFLTKPYEPDILREKVKVFLELDRHRNKLAEMVTKEENRTAELAALNERLKIELAERVKTEERERLSARVFEHVGESIIITDPDCRIIYTNPACTVISGYTAKDMLGQKPSILQSGHHEATFYEDMWKVLLDKGRWQGEVWNRRKNGEVYPQWLNISSIKDTDGEITHYVAMGQDITDIKKSEEKILHQAHYDHLTDLPNRVLFEDRLNHAIARVPRGNEKVALMFMDLDHFKNLNDSLGHHAGDLFLKQVALQFVDCLREEDTVSRLGGDEFTVILEGINQKEDAAVVADKIISLFAKPFVIGGNEVYMGISIGIALYPDCSKEVKNLIKYADLAMYHAKDQGRNNYQFFQPDFESKVVEKVTMETHLRKGIENRELLAYYQPVINLESGEITGMEALMRWNRPGHGLVLPGIFIPIAEDKGLIVAMGEWILRQACEYVVSLTKLGFPSLALAVNLSARQFRDKGLVNKVERILQDTGFQPESLHLEITETTLMDNMESSIITMKRLKDMGIQISLDDFGTGYSSFNYLKHFPLDTLKLDHTFIKDITTDQDSARIAAAIISLARGLGLQVIAEGVENKQQLAFLDHFQCKKAQGFLFSKPVSGEDFLDLIKSKKKFGK